MTRRKHLILILALLIALPTIGYIKNGNSGTPEITLNVNKAIYNIGDKADFWGNVTLDGGVLSDALVAIEVDNPIGTAVILRTRPTGTINVTTPVQTLSITPCDEIGTPKVNFSVNTLAFFKILINNSENATRQVEVTLNLFDSKTVAFDALTVFKGPLYSGDTELFVSEPIPADVSSGNATIYCNVFTSLPKNGGYSLCLETRASFMIINGGPAVVTGPEQNSQGMYNLTFPVDNYKQKTRPFRPGFYNVTVTCRYQSETTSLAKAFEVVLLGDINRDGAVNILDAILLSNSFLKSIGQADFNPNADLNGDGVVNILDAIILSNNFGNTA
jgi:hypothetical protein